MNSYGKKIDQELIALIKNKANLSILELGVQRGNSTKKFLNLCEINNGYLYSVDIDDCSKVVNNNRWTFIQSRDDNFNYIKSKIPKNIDVIFIDTKHEAEHVENLIYNYYDLVSPGGYIFVDDISHLPYLPQNNKQDFYCYVNNQETFEKLLQIYFYNQENFELNFSFSLSGLAIIKKIRNGTLNKNKKLTSIKFSVKNLLRKIWKKIII